MEVIKRPLGLYKANCYVLIKEGKSIIIDPGFHCNHIIDMVADSEPIAVLLTHGCLLYTSESAYGLERPFVICCLNV